MQAAEPRSAARRRTRAPEPSHVSPSQKMGEATILVNATWAARRMGHPESGTKEGRMHESWRWFGPKDPIDLAAVRQTGATGIVSALHHLPPGALWTADEIAARQRSCEGPPVRLTGLAWTVVESLPVSEDIKRQTGDWREHVADVAREPAEPCGGGDRGRLLQLHAGARLDADRPRLGAAVGGDVHAVRPGRLRGFRPASSWSGRARRFPRP